MKTTISSKGQIVLPADIREQDRIVPGQQFEVERLRAGEYLLRKVAGTGQPGLVQWLRSCPDQDWFQSIPSESTEDLPGVIPGDGPRRAKR
jgi:AbrB family looped-hinge helix DNA binding protein